MIELLNKTKLFIANNPEAASVYVVIGVLVVTIIGLFIGKAISKKKIFKQSSGDQSQNIQGEKVDIQMGDNQWK